MIGDVTKISHLSLAKCWEACKERINGLSIKYGVTKYPAQCGQCHLLVHLAEHLKLKLDQGNSSCLGPYNLTLAELAKIDLNAAQGAQIRSCVQWVEEGESSSSFFFRLEKKHGADRRISAPKASDSTIVSDTSPHYVMQLRHFTLIFFHPNQPMLTLVPPCCIMAILPCSPRMHSLVMASLPLINVLLLCVVWRVVKPLALMVSPWHSI